MSGSTEPLVSFVVLCYNTERYAGECIRSILALRTGLPFEIIALDDHSPDKTFDVLKSFDDPRLTVIRNEKNLGHAAAIEVAFRAARGRYIARIDSDDRYRPDFLDDTVRILEEHPEVGMVYANTAIIGTDGAHLHDSTDSHHAGKDFKGNELIALLELNFICAPTIIARRELFLSLLPVPSHLAFHDWWFTVGIARRAEFFYLNAVLADYRVHPGNMHSRTILDRTEEKSIFWFLDHVYSQPESDPGLQSGKLLARRRIYARHSLTLADKYFGARMNSDARRCYWRALKFRPGYLLSPGIVRRFVASVAGRSVYEAAKRLVSPQRVSVAAQ